MSSSEWTVPDNRNNDNNYGTETRAPGIISLTLSFKYQDLQMLAICKMYQVSLGRYGIQKIKTLKSK